MKELISLFNNYEINQLFNIFNENDIMNFERINKKKATIIFSFNNTVAFLTKYKYDKEYFILLIDDIELKAKNFDVIINYIKYIRK